MQEDTYSRSGLANIRMTLEWQRTGAVAWPRQQRKWRLAGTNARKDHEDLLNQCDARSETAESRKAKCYFDEMNDQGR